MSAGVPLVSIVTPSFNQARYLEAAMASVLGQDHPRLEYIVIDGGSQDGSLEIIERHAGRLAHWTSEPDRGQGEAINKGLQRARGEIVAWLNSDDLYMQGAVSAAVQALARHPEAGMVYADGLMVDAQGRLLDRHRYRGYSVLDLLCFDVLLQPTVFMRREALEQAGLLREPYHLILDHDLWVRLAARGPIVHVPGFWAAERTHAEAKTIALAAGFVSEAETLLRWARGDPLLAPLVERHAVRIRASLHAFALRRLIDAGDYRAALDRFSRCLAEDPAVALRYWYKGLQALAGRLGAAPAFLAYRRLRRRVQNPSAFVEVGPRGGRLVRGAGPTPGRGG